MAFVRNRRAGTVAGRSVAMGDPGPVSCAQDALDTHARGWRKQGCRPYAETLGCSGGCGGRCGMGADELGGDAAVARLQEELNRFAGSGSGGFPVTGILDTNTASAAVLVMMRRAREAMASGIDTTDASAKLLLAATGAIANPVPFVRANLSTVLEVVSRYADAQRLPPARGGKVPVAKLAVAAGILAGILYLRRRR